MSRTIDYASLLTALAEHDADPTLSLSQIEELIGTTLSPSARRNPAYWRHSGNRLAQQLRDAGWRATLHPERGVVAFGRIPVHASPGTRPSQMDPLFAFLAAQEGECLRLSFDQLQAILGGTLVRTARLDPAWWDERGQYAGKWAALRWEARLDIRGRAVAFRHVR